MRELNPRIRAEISQLIGIIDYLLDAKYESAAELVEKASSIIVVDLSDQGNAIVTIDFTRSQASLEDVIVDTLLSVKGISKHSTFESRHTFKISQEQEEDAIIKIAEVKQEAVSKTCLTQVFAEIKNQESQPRVFSKKPSPADIVKSFRAFLSAFQLESLGREVADNLARAGAKSPGNILS